jgi:hypothetical protein
VSPQLTLPVVLATHCKVSSFRSVGILLGFNWMLRLIHWHASGV